MGSLAARLAGQFERVMTENELASFFEALGRLARTHDAVYITEAQADLVAHHCRVSIDLIRNGKSTLYGKPLRIAEIVNA